MKDQNGNEYSFTASKEFSWGVARIINEGAALGFVMWYRKRAHASAYARDVLKNSYAIIRGWEL